MVLFYLAFATYQHPSYQVPTAQKVLAYQTYSAPQPQVGFTLLLFSVYTCKFCFNFQYKQISAAVPAPPPPAPSPQSTSTGHSGEGATSYAAFTQHLTQVQPTAVTPVKVR